MYNENVASVQRREQREGSAGPSGLNRQLYDSTPDMAGNRGSGGKAIPRFVQQFIMCHPCFPITAVSQTKPWQKSQYKYLMLSDKVYQRAMQSVQLETSQWTMRQFLKYYKELKATPIFGAINCRVSDLYYNIEESVQHLVNLLEYQLNSNEEIDESMEIRQFLYNLHSVCERKIPKINTMYVVSPPSSGKNWFFDCVQAFYLNAGNIGNFNRNCQFPFEDTVNRRINKSF